MTQLNKTIYKLFYQFISYFTVIQKRIILDTWNFKFTPYVYFFDSYTW